MKIYILFICGTFLAFIGSWFESYFLLMSEFAKPFEATNFEATCLSTHIIQYKPLFNVVDKLESSMYHASAFNRSLSISISSQTAADKEIGRQDREQARTRLIPKYEPFRYRANSEAAINIIYLQPYLQAKINTEDHGITQNLLKIIIQVAEILPVTVRQFDRFYDTDSTSDIHSTSPRYYQQQAEQVESSIKRNCNTCQHDVFFVIIMNESIDQLLSEDQTRQQTVFTYSAKGLIITPGTASENHFDNVHSDSSLTSSIIINHLRQYLFINPISHHLLEDNQTMTKSSKLYETEIAAEVASRVCYEYAWMMHWLQRMHKDVSGFELWRLWRLSNDEVSSLLSIFTMIRPVTNLFRYWNESSERLHGSFSSEIINEQDRVKLKDSLATIRKVNIRFKPLQHEINLKLVERPQWQMLFVIFAPFWLPVSVPLIKLLWSRRQQKKKLS